MCSADLFCGSAVRLLLTTKSRGPTKQVRACWYLDSAVKCFQAAGSVSSEAKYKIEARGLGEGPEVPVSREEGNASVNTALGNQRVADARLAALGQHLRTQ